MKSRSTPLTLAVACCGLLALAGCRSEPGPKAVARDMVETLQGVDTDAKQCMLDKINDEYSDDDLNAIGENNAGFLSTNPSALDDATPEMKAFVADLQSCLSNG